MGQVQRGGLARRQAQRRGESKGGPHRQGTSPGQGDREDGFIPQVMEVSRRDQGLSSWTLVQSRSRDRTLPHPCSSSLGIPLEKRRKEPLPAFRVNSCVGFARSRLDQLPE